MVKKSPFPDILIPEQDIPGWLLAQIENYGDGVAMVDNKTGEQCTFRQVRDQVRKCADALYRGGLRKGDVVAICSSNRIEYPIVLLASTACGAIASGCNPLFGEEEIVNQFKVSNPCLIFCDDDIFSKIERVHSRLSCVKTVYTFGQSSNSNCYEKLLSNGRNVDLPDISINAKEDVFILPYSSGTTGLPKGVMNTHYNLMAQIALNRVHSYMARSSCYYMVVPMFHQLGYTFSLYCLFQGVKNVIDRRFDLDRMLRAFETHRVTHFMAVPPIMILLAETQLRNKYDTSSLQRMICGGAPIAPHLVETISECFQMSVTPGYGLTEMAPLSVCDPVISKPNSVGTISSNTTVKVIDIETGRELGDGEDGEILAKGPQLMKGYLKNPEATANSIDSDGWFHTGDIGHYDQDGMLYIVDRVKELIKYKAFQVAPSELEATLLTHPGIADVAVVGIPDSIAGEIPKAFVVKRDPFLSENDVIVFVKGKLVNYKHLRGGVEFIQVIPKSPSGKLLRRELRKCVSKI